MKITNGNIICKSAAIPAACLLALAANVTASVVRVRKVPFPAKIVGRYKAELTANPIAKDVITGTAISGILIRHNRLNLEKPNNDKTIDFCSVHHENTNASFVWSEAKNFVKESSSLSSSSCVKNKLIFILT